MQAWTKTRAWSEADAGFWGVPVLEKLLWGTGMGCSALPQHHRAFCLGAGVLSLQLKAINEE